jgi:hypothetical protein
MASAPRDVSRALVEEREELVSTMAAIAEIDRPTFEKLLEKMRTLVSDSDNRDESV